MTEQTCSTQSARCAITIGICLFLAHATAMGHQFWIEPSAFLMKESAPVRVRLVVGEHFAGEPVARKADRIIKFALIGPDGEKPIDGVEGRDPAGFFAAPTPGAYSIAYRTNHAFIQLDAEKFTAYLKEEGLDSIIKLRAERGESEKPAREAYARCAKALIRVSSTTAPSASDPAGDGIFDRPAGLPLELIAENDPYSLKAGDRLGVRLLLDGKPLVNAQVVAVSKKSTTDEHVMRTDEKGRVSFKPYQGGQWLVHGVHMRPAPTGIDADWESLWASLTFEAPADLSSERKDGN